MASQAIFLNLLIFHTIFRLHFLRLFQSPILQSIVSNHGIHRYLTIFLSSHHHAHPVCRPSTPSSSTSTQLTTPPPQLERVRSVENAQVDVVHQDDDRPASHEHHIEQSDKPRAGSMCSVPFFFSNLPNVSL